MKRLYSSSFILLFLISKNIFPGDYTLYISNKIDTICIPPVASSSSEFNPIKSSTEVIDDLNKYFSGKEPELKLLRVFFGNGHLIFCSNIEKEEVLTCLINILLKKEISHLDDLYDFLNVLSSNELLKIIDFRMADNLSQKIKKRLVKAKANIILALRNKRL